MTTSTLIVQQTVSSTGQLITELVPVFYLLLGLGFALFAFFAILKPFLKYLGQMLR